MRHHAHAVRWLITGLCVVVGLLGTDRGVNAQSGKAWSAPKTAWGDPDLSGIWNFATMTPLERARDNETLVLAPAEAAAYEARTNERQRAGNNTAGPDWWDPGTRLLTEGRLALVVDPPDGRLPPTTPEYQARAARATQLRRQRGELDGPEDLGLNVRCISWATAGPPMLPGVYNNNVQFIQTKDYVVILNEMIHDARIVPMGGHSQMTFPQWMGDSRGHWDGQSLVVETVGFNGRISTRGSDDHLHLVERFTRTDADTITYQFTMDDPTVWVRSWTARYPMHHTEGPMYEYACHEGNYKSMEGLLRAARTSEPAIPAR